MPAIDDKLIGPQIQDGDDTIFQNIRKFKKRLDSFTDYIIIILACCVGILPIIDPKHYPGNPIEYFIIGLAIAVLWYSISLKKRGKSS